LLSNQGLELAGRQAYSEPNAARNTRHDRSFTCQPTAHHAWRWLQRYGYLVALIPIAQAIGGFMVGGWRAWEVPLVAFGLAPLVDSLLGDDPSPPPTGDEPKPSLWHDLMLYAFVLGYWALLLFGLGEAADGGWTLTERLGNTLSMGIVGGLGIVVAHELGHRKTTFPRIMAQMLLQPVGYGHFTLEHNRGHHAWVATPDDPATARLGESFSVFTCAACRPPGGLPAGWRSNAWHGSGCRPGTRAMPCGGTA
jgi:alkane 1-monooxygenase